MRIGNHQTIGAHDHARSQRIFHARTQLQATKQLTENRIGEKRIELLLYDLFRINIDDSGLGGLNHRRKTQLDLNFRLRHNLIGGRRRDR